ncbi:MAG: hypothetical protein L0220_34795 [Acidobacteria bacterium]|nr:hypothetical protein [Acidobacteriota bacterium]
MYCPSCGMEHGTNTKYCKRCGVVLNLTNTGVQTEPVNFQLNLAGPFWALAAIGIGGLFILTIFYKKLWQEGARDESLFLPFIFGTGLIAIIAIVMGLLLARFLSFQTKVQNKPQPELRQQPFVQPTGQVRIPSPGISYQAGASVVEESTRRIPEYAYAL